VALAWGFTATSLKVVFKCLGPS